MLFRWYQGGFWVCEGFLACNADPFGRQHRLHFDLLCLLVLGLLCSHFGLRLTGSSVFYLMLLREALLRRFGVVLCCRCRSFRHFTRSRLPRWRSRDVGADFMQVSSATSVWTYDVGADIFSCCSLCFRSRSLVLCQCSSFSILGLDCLRRWRSRDVGADFV